MTNDRNDRGATALLVALCLLLLFGMLSLAIDIGFGFRERRTDQTGADSSALGGALEMVITPGANPVQAAINRIYALVDTNLGRAVPLADWDGCTDPDALFWMTKSDAAILGTTNGSDCISLSEDFNTLRVRVPVQETPTLFASVMGFDTIPVSAAAEAERNTDWGGGGDFPSGVLSGTDAGTTICVKSGPSGHESCGPPSTGDFANFKPYFYSAVDGYLSTMCVSAEQNQPMARAMADGIDHEFSGYNLVSPNPRINGQWCLTSGVPGPPFPNMVDSAAGYQNADITNGLVMGGNWPTPFTGRLTRGPYVNGTATVYGVAVDNRPLWDYIDDSIAMMGAPDCVAVRARPASVLLTDYPTVRAELEACIQEAVSGPPMRIFTSDILNTHRLVHAPLYHEISLLPNNSCCYHIKGLMPVFIDGVWTRSTHASFTCDGEFDDTTAGMCIHRPGLAGSLNVNPPGQKNIDSASGIVLSCALLPEGTCPTIQDGTGPLNFLYDLQLTR